MQVNLEVVAPEPPLNHNDATGTPVEYFYALALVVVVAVLAISAVVLKKRRK